MVRRHIYFSGRVQGVGFRFQASWAAKRLDLTGWVRNLDVQGEPHVIDRMLEALREDSFIRISDIDSVEIPLAEGERKFRTSY